MESHQEGQSFPEKHICRHIKLNNSPTGKQMDLTTENHLRHSDLAIHSGVSLRETEQHVQRPRVGREQAPCKELIIRNTQFLFW